MRTPFRRRRVLVDPRLQGSLMLHGLLYGSLVLAAVCVGLFAPLLWQLAEIEQAPTFEEHAIVMLYLHERCWALVAVSVALVVVGAVRFSHRVAGPMVRYKRNLRLIADGRLPPPLRSRPGDLLQEEVECLNTAVDGVVARVDAIRHAQVALRRELTAVIDRSVDAGHELAALVEACDVLEDRVRAFRRVDTGDTVAEPKPRVLQQAMMKPTGSV